MAIKRSKKHKTPVNTTDVHDVTSLIKETQKLILSRPIMNGGFDSMLVKIENVEKQQGVITEKIEGISLAIYHPDDGLFAKNTQMMSALENLKEKQILNEKNDSANVAKIEALTKNVEILERTVQITQKWQERFNSILKYIAVTAVTGILSIVGKYAYEYVTKHVQLY